MPVTIVGNNTPTAGGVVYGDGTNYASTAAGTSGQPIVSGGAGAPTFRPFTLPSADGTNGQVLQTNGSGALSFATPATGAMVLLSSVVASSSATVDLETGFGSTYDSYMILGYGLVPSANPASGLNFQLKLGGTYQTSGYAGYVSRPTSNTSTFQGAAVSGSAGSVVSMFGSPAAGTGAALNFTMWIQDVNSTSNCKGVYSTAISFQEGSNPVVVTTSGGMINNVTTALTGIRFTPGSGNIASGTFRLYGIAKS